MQSLHQDTLHLPHQAFIIYTSDFNQKTRKEKFILPNRMSDANVFLSRIGFFLCCSLLQYPAPARSAGIAIMEQSTVELGRAFSGAPTNTADGSMVFFNPAAMSQVRGKLISSAGYIFVPYATFHDSSSTNALGTPLKGSDGGNLVGPSFVPNFYYVQELTNRIAFGMGINIPFAALNSYHSDWKGRYQGIDSEITAFNFNPSLSLKITEKFSFGAGFNVQYLKTKLTNAIDFGSICLSAAPPSLCASQGLLPQEADGHASLKGDNVGFGYNFGVFYALSPKINLGASYRSRVYHHIHGNANFSVPDNAVMLTQKGSFIDTASSTPVTLPDNVLFGISYLIKPRWNVTADAQWTHWSLIRELRTDFQSNQMPDIQPMHWNDTWRYALGINYLTENNKWMFRTGFAYDQTPIPNPQNRSARLPDSNRYWLTAGFTYALLKNISIHGAYAHLFLDSPAINRTGVTGDTLSGKYTEQVDIIGMQLDWRF